jgi:hypothetical protein
MLISRFLGKQECRTQAPLRRPLLQLRALQGQPRAPARRPHMTATATSRWRPRTPLLRSSALRRMATGKADGQGGDDAHPDAGQGGDTTPGSSSQGAGGVYQSVRLLRHSACHDCSRRKTSTLSSFMGSVPRLGAHTNPDGSPSCSVPADSDLPERTLVVGVSATMMDLRAGAHALDGYGGPSALLRLRPLTDGSKRYIQTSQIQAFCVLVICL